MKHIKIGYSRSINGVLTRWRSLQTANADRLNLLAICLDNGTRLTEKTLHNIFDTDRLAGEWFKFSDKLMQVVNDSKYVGERNCILAAKEERDEREQQERDIRIEASKLGFSMSPRRIP